MKLFFIFLGCGLADTKLIAAPASIFLGDSDFPDAPQRLDHLFPSDFLSFSGVG
jgi:hypothetical protein